MSDLHDEVEQILQQIATKSVVSLAQINRRLAELDAQIKAAQPNSSGSVILHSRRHEKPCAGCPHYSWSIWLESTKRGVRHYSRYTIDNPQQRKRRGDIGRKLSPLIHEAEKLMALKKKLTASFAYLNKQPLYLPPEPPV
ncbi:hypothetical protein [Sinimarinibacterium sp. NLF-5-8]|uniref:hypothetical protein n=1 Tax=Sinimarinibacterium sp. NLF-5-8 TaxID=2698684 RepID=UPI00137BB560|nr:hypothetical protein [Sinimarinibacterium sp. NLF-5-8]QHS09006.1 hypothetical protein GT972_01845 [Sinimarinibacterium sp. NLF-5-8]